MNTTIKFALALMLMLTSQAFFAQKIVTSDKQQQIINHKAEKEAKKSSDEYHAKLNDEQAKLKREQKRVEKEKKQVEKHQKDLKNSEKDLQNNKKKISKLETDNQKMNSKLGSLSD